MKVDGALNGTLAEVAARARQLEEAGYDGIYNTEGGHDPFFPHLLAAGATSRVQLVTEVAIAFARNPLTVATLAHDLQTYSQGRFMLGLGSQIRPHIEKRFSMPWSAPAPRMREFVLAVRAIWRAWEEGEKLDFRGKHYTHTLMTPTFSPGKSGFGSPPILIAAVGPKMNEVAGEVADGVIHISFNTPKYIEGTLVPSIAAGLAKSGRTREQFTVAAQVMVATGRDAASAREARGRFRSLISFYGSTPSYRPVLEAHGWGEMQDELNAMSKQGRWTEMAASIPEEVIDAIVVHGDPVEVAAQLKARFAGVADRLSFIGADIPDDVAAEVIRQLR